MPNDVERICGRDLEVVVDTVASAFAADPLLLWILRQPRDPEARLRRFFRATISAELRRSSPDVYRNAESSCVAVWKTQPATEPSNPWTLVRQLPALVGAVGLGIARAKQAADATASAHPSEPHYYLEVLATRRDDQSGGRGSAMLRHLLAACDSAGIGAYLETANPRTIAFYERFGFTVSGRVPLPVTAPEVVTMWRT